MAKTKEEYNAYMRDYMLKRYYRRRAEAIERLGGKCVDCGTDKNLEFDHADASTKSYDVAKLFGSASNSKLENELAKCVLRCIGCHKLKGQTNGDQRQVEHGGGLTGKKNCRCDLCGPLKNAYNLELKRRKRERS